MKIRGVFGLVGLPIVLLTACSSPANDIAFQAPPGWRSTPPIMGRMQMWMKGTSGEGNFEIVMLIKGGSTVSDDMDTFGTSGNLRDVKRETITLCNGQSGEHFTGLGQSRNSQSHREVRVDGISSRINGSEYIALYIRPLELPVDTQAETAIHSLCAKSG